tara:strand:+ start:4616 stop:5167 length:552 start_codon:yes stop_codon:yes gene_type:complete
MSTLNLIVAADSDGTIGVQTEEKGWTLPWRCPKDLAHFQQKTLGHTVIMGRKTWDSLPHKPLPGRQNIVLTRQAAIKHDDVEFVQSIEGALMHANHTQIWFIGGGQIYTQILPFVDNIWFTKIRGATTTPEQRTVKFHTFEYFLSTNWRVERAQSLGFTATSLNSQHHLAVVYQLVKVKVKTL